MRDNLKLLLKRLLNNDVDFVLAGGFACTLHGSPLVTQDIDICVAFDDTQIAKLREALKDLKPKLRMNPNFKPSFLEHPKRSNELKNIYLETDLGILDMMSELQPIGDFRTVKENSISVDLYGHVCKVVSLEDLIKIKETMSRPKDKEALRYLREILRLRPS